MKYLLVLMCLVFSFSLGCGAHSTYDLGIPISKSESFFFHMKEASVNSGFDTVTNQDGDLVIRVAEGSLTYKPNSYGDGLAVTLFTNSHDDDNVEAQWLDSLEQIHLQLLADAKALAKTNQAW